MADAVGDKKNAIDRISSLPDEILLHIFSFVLLDDTRQTRFLSKRFHKLWRLIPILDCRDNGYWPDQFKKFMKKALSNHEQLTRVQIFRFSCYHSRYGSTTVSQWIDSAVTASVSNLLELYLHVSQFHRVKLPCSVFSCQKLKFLKLSGDIIVDEIPTGLLFPCLKTLELEKISIVFEILMNYLLSTVCPVIEISLIRDCSLKISSKNETRLHFIYLRGSWVQGNCPNNLSKRVLKDLELQDSDMFQIVRFMGKDGNPPFFQDLTHLKVNIGRTGRFLTLPLLLQHSPKLTFLELKAS
ncbi:hypothetical protein PTKIN_Ptkin11bG0171900 [Pterospermum kingtungense]